MGKLKKNTGIMNTYSKKKGKSHNKAPVINFYNVNVHNNYFNIYNLHNSKKNGVEEELSPPSNDPTTVSASNISKSGSGDEFDKLLKGPVYHSPAKTHLPSFSTCERKYFLQRQETINSFCSNATSSLNVSSVHLFKDFTDSSSYSPLNVESPQFFNGRKKYIIKAPLQRKNDNRVLQQKNDNRVLKRNVPKQFKAKRPVNKVKTVSAASSTPTNPNMFPCKNKWHVSPIRPLLNISNDSREDLFGNDVLCSNKSDSEVKSPPQQHGVSCLLEGLRNLGIVTPKVKNMEVNLVVTPKGKNKDETLEIVTPKTNNKVQYQSINEVCEETPLKTNTRTNLKCPYLLRSAKKCSPLHIKEETLKKDCNHENISVKDCSSRKDIKRIDTTEEKDSERVIEKSVKALGSEIDTKLKYSSLSIQVSRQLLEEEESRLSLSDPETNHPENNLADNETVNNVRRSLDSRLHCDENVSDSNCTIDQINKLTSQSGLLHEVLIPHESLEEKSYSKGIKYNNRLSLTPGKKWRRSLLNTKLAGTERCTIGPSILSKLIKDANNFNCYTNVSGFSCNFSMQSFNQLKHSDDYFCSNHRNTSFCETSNNSTINCNTSEILQKISIRPRRHNGKPGKLFYEYDGMDKIFEERLSEESCSEIPPESYSPIKGMEFSSNEPFTAIQNISQNSFNHDRQTICYNQSKQYNTDDPLINPDNTRSKLELCPGLENPPVKKSQNDNSAIYCEGNECNCVTNPQSATSRSILETPPALSKLGANALSTITKRRKNYETSHSFKGSDNTCDKLIFVIEDNYEENTLDILFEDEDNKRDYNDVADFYQGAGMYDEPLHQAKTVVLMCCEQQHPIPFMEPFTDEVLKTCKKIGEGVYGEVFMLERTEAENTVLKIIPVEGNQLVNNEPQKHFDEVLSELIITQQLSSLRQNSQFCTSGFCELKKMYCLQGQYPAMLIHLWNNYDKQKGSDNDSPNMFECDQLYIVLELEHAGDPVESFKFDSYQQAYSVFLQTAFSLAVAEASLEFEHRDLHVGNVLVKKTGRDYVKFTLNSYCFKLPTYGIKATIIDFTLSRISYKGEVLFFDMATDPDLFIAEGDYQFEIYRLMRDDLNNQWINHKPITNIRWLHYLIDKLLVAKCTNTKKNKIINLRYLKRLKKIKETVLDFQSSFAFSENIIRTDTETASFIETD